MSKERLLATAAALAPPSQLTGERLGRESDGLARQLTEAMTAHGDLAALIGDGNNDLMDTNHANHFKYMSTLASLYEPTSFVETVLWVIRSYRSRGFSVRYWEVMLPEAVAIIEQTLPVEMADEMSPLYTWILNNLSDLVNLSSEPSFFERLSPFESE